MSDGRLNETGAAIISICDEGNTMGRQVSVNTIGRTSISESANPGSGCL